MFFTLHKAHTPNSFLVLELLWLLPIKWAMNVNDPTYFSPQAAISVLSSVPIEHLAESLMISQPSLRKQKGTPTFPGKWHQCWLRNLRKFIPSSTPGKLIMHMLLDMEIPDFTIFLDMEIQNGSSNFSSRTFGKAPPELHLRGKQQRGLSNTVRSLWKVFPWPCRSENDSIQTFVCRWKMSIS